MANNSLGILASWQNVGIVDTYDTESNKYIQMYKYPDGTSGYWKEDKSNEKLEKIKKLLVMAHGILDEIENPTEEQKLVISKIEEFFTNEK